MKIHYKIESIPPSDKPRRLREQDTVARMIAHLMGMPVTIGHSADGAPFIPNTDIYISISHSAHYAALAWSEQPGIGIDIEEPRHDQLLKVSHRFLNPDEISYYSSIPNGLLRAWTLKEAAFKALRNGTADLYSYRLPLNNSDTLITVHDGIRSYPTLSIIKSEMHGSDLYISLVAVNHAPAIQV